MHVAVAGCRNLDSILKRAHGWNSIKVADVV